MNCGLSPLARGTLQWLPLHHNIDRFIPAGAGNTASRSNGCSTITVYPRWRGEHADFKQARNPAFRFIPAGAGNTGESLRRGSCGAVYPRWRGEHNFFTPFSAGENGLSPLARGTLIFIRR
ncbi:hypothetical protein EC01288_2928 [Escherichia coli 0.1288]|nr:hypothetical protein EC01288_2928 [Escherichia coli 0.1288]